MVLVWLTCVVLFSAYIAVVVSVFRRRKVEQRFLFHFRLYLFFVFLAGAIFYFGYDFFKPQLQHDVWLHAVGVYFCFVLGFLIFYGLLDRSVSVRINLNLLGAKPATRDEILKLYGAEHSIDRRFEMMVENGYLVRNQDIYTLTPKGMKTARRTALFKKIFSIGLGG